MPTNPVMYATLTQFAAMGLPEETTKIVDGNVVQQHVALASGRINSYLRSQYKLPLQQNGVTADYPIEIVNCCCALAAYTLMQFIGYNPNGSDDKYQARSYEMTGNPNVSGSKGWLDAVAEGTVSLAFDADATPDVREGAPVIVSSPSRDWYDLSTVGSP